MSEENPTTPEEETAEPISVKTLIFGEGVQFDDVDAGSSVEDWLRTRQLPDAMLQNGVSIKVNGFDANRSSILKDGDTIVLAPQKSAGGN